MSENNSIIGNQEKFNVAMAVGSMVGMKSGTKYEKYVSEWTYDIEVSNLALYVYDKVHGKDWTNETIKNIVDEYFTKDQDIIELPVAENDADYCDIWNGVECGDFFGIPEEETIDKAKEAVKLFLEQTQYGYVHEVIVANRLV